MSDLVARIKDLPVFSTLSADELTSFAQLGRVEHYAAKATLFEQGHGGQRLMVLMDGSADVLREDDGNQVLLASLGAGEVLGELSLLLDFPRTATVVAVEAVSAFVIDRDVFEARLADKDPAALAFALALGRVLAQRMVHLNDQVVQLLAANAALNKQFRELRGTLIPLWG